MSPADEYPEMHQFYNDGPALPWSLEAEQAVLGALMIDPGALARVSDWLKADDFFRGDHRLIYQAITGLAEAKAPCDAITMAEWFERAGTAQRVDRAYPVELANNTPSGSNVVAYAEIVFERSRLRQAHLIGSTLTTTAGRAGASSEAVIANASHQLAGLQISRLRGGLVSSREAMARMQAALFERYELAEKLGPDAEVALIGLATPWRDVNKTTKGLRDGQVIIVAARPNMGKSVAGGEMAIFSAMSGSRAAWFSVEMTADECMARGVAAVGRIPFAWVDAPTPHVPDAETYWNRLTKATGDILSADLLIDDTPGINIDQLMARARRAHRQKPLRLIVVDHMHDMGLESGKEVRHEYGRIVQGCKTLAKEFNCPVVVLAQLNRAMANRQDKRPTMTDLRESGEIEQKADVILFLHREDYYDPRTPDKGLVEVIIAKGRNIKTGEIIKLQNRFDEMRLGDFNGWGEDFEDGRSFNSDNWAPRITSRSIQR